MHLKLVGNAIVREHDPINHDPIAGDEFFGQRIKCHQCRAACLLLNGGEVYLGRDPCPNGRLSSNLNQLIHLAAQCVFGFLGCRIAEHNDLQGLLGQITLP